ncbi:hypothetical protein SD457_10845 [Coprobacillaceae bacterium CR2/5/TPMF4]|nr:hypothetical protein SD457_10845 [Coprobacillaceae bacterium CR2/5/TPMF4]
MPAPEKNYNTYDIPGRDGTLYEDLGTIDDIEIEVECNYIASEHLWNEKWREIKNGFLKGISCYNSVMIIPAVIELKQLH